MQIDNMLLCEYLMKRTWGRWSGFSSLYTLAYSLLWEGGNFSVAAYCLISREVLQLQQTINAKTSRILCVFIVLII